MDVEVNRSEHVSVYDSVFAGFTVRGDVKMNDF